uniref:Reverse transcriptase domain-containing protein n=1 Tax=Macrostomum lignano TaxID=282301 RepID=A0A1I8FDS2_9PLAT
DCPGVVYPGLATPEADLVLRDASFALNKLRSRSYTPIAAGPGVCGRMHLASSQRVRSGPSTGASSNSWPASACQTLKKKKKSGEPDLACVAKMLLNDFQRAPAHYAQPARQPSSVPDFLPSFLSLMQHSGADVEQQQPTEGAEQEPTEGARAVATPQWEQRRLTKLAKAKLRKAKASGTAGAAAAGQRRHNSRERRRGGARSAGLRRDTLYRVNHSAMTQTLEQLLEEAEGLVTQLHAKCDADLPQLSRAGLCRSCARLGSRLAVRQASAPRKPGQPSWPPPSSWPGHGRLGAPSFPRQLDTPCRPSTAPTDVPPRFYTSNERQNALLTAVEHSRARTGSAIGMPAGGGGAALSDSILASKRAAPLLPEVAAARGGSGTYAGALESHTPGRPGQRATRARISLRPGYAPRCRWGKLGDPALVDFFWALIDRVGSAAPRCARISARARARRRFNGTRPRRLALEHLEASYGRHLSDKRLPKETGQGRLGGVRLATGALIRAAFAGACPDRRPGCSKMARWTADRWRLRPRLGLARSCPTVDPYRRLLMLPDGALRCCRLSWRPWPRSVEDFLIAALSQIAWNGRFDRLSLGALQRQLKPKSTAEAALSGAWQQPLLFS